MPNRDGPPFELRRVDLQRQGHQGQKTISFSHWLMRGVWLIVTLGLCRIFYNTWRFVPWAADGGSQGLPFSITTYDTAAQWGTCVGKLKKEWKQICLGCALNLSVSVALLQIDVVLQKGITRTTTVMAYILSGAGLMLSTTFNLVIYRCKKGRCPSRWIEASESFDNLKSVEFWSLLALPLSLLVWSVIFCIITVLALPWTVQNGGAESGIVATRLGIIFGVLLPMTLTLMVTGLVYQAVIFARRLH